MAGKHDQERLDALRERLYARGQAPENTKRTELTDEPNEVPEAWPQPEPTPKKRPLAAATKAAASFAGGVRNAVPRPSRDPKSGPERATPTVDASTTDAPSSSEHKNTMQRNNSKYSYRVKIMLTALFFFVAAVVLSSLFIFFGGNSISGENIDIAVSGPFTVGGGEELPIQVGITNQNSVAIESATLIVEYPRGTQSVENEGQELFIDRIPLDSIRSGETVNVPLRARVFGEENDEHTIRASVEYRVEGSNATFFREAEPYRFKISSAPVSIEVDTVKAIASGQETDLTLTIRSNASQPITNILVRAEYPVGFDFVSANPSPVSGQGIWMIDELLPEEDVTIELTGIMVGTESDTRTMHFTVGLPNERDPLTLASVFSTASTEFTVEQPFANVSIVVNNQEGGDFSIEPGDQSSVVVRVRNSLNEAIRNAEVRATLSGNALSDMNVYATNGFYDSNTRTVVWDASSAPNLARIDPNRSEQFRFVVEPKTDALRTPQINIDVSVRAQRTREGQVSEELIGTAEASIKVASGVTLLTEVGHNSTSIDDYGPIPPVVGEQTTYTVSFRVEGGSNDVADATVTTSLPSYVTWLDETIGDGSFSYNAANRTVTWTAGTIESDEAAMGSFQISLLPSTSQIDTTPTLVSEQIFRASDRFTGTDIRASNNALTTRLPSETGFPSGNGDVQPAD